MNKAILLFVALFALVGADFIRMPLDQGVIRTRNLASSSLSSYSFDNYTSNFGVRVNMSSYYLTSVSRDNNTATDMLVFLYTNLTGFSTGGSYFVPFGCDNYNNCSADTTQTQSLLGANFYTSGNPFNFSNLTIGSDSTSTAWKLNTTALLFTYGSSKSIYYPSGSTGYNSNNYFRNTSAYGFIGLGVGGNASQNFQTTTPIFSVSVNTSGSGSIIFGKDTTLYDSSKTGTVLTTDTNWNMISRNMSWGSLINSSSFISTVLFDLQSPAIQIPMIYKSVYASFYTQYSLTQNTTYGNTDYPTTYSGLLSALPDLTFGLTNDKNITIPPAGYTRQLATNFYAILIAYVDTTYNSTSGQYLNYTVLGWPALAQFYSVFEYPTTGIPTVTLYTPTASASSSSSGSGFSMKTLAIVAAVVLIVLVALSAVCKKKQDFTKSDLGVELRAARV